MSIALSMGNLTELLIFFDMIAIFGQHLELECIAREEIFSSYEIW